MDYHFWWLVAGFILVIAELLTGTFYLLVLGIAAFAGAATAWTGGTFGLQAAATAAVAFAGVAWVHRWRARTVHERMPHIDVGQPAVFESWIDRAAGLARVRYRDSTWDAVIEEPVEGEPGQVLYIVAVQGNTLRLAGRPVQHGSRP